MARNLHFTNENTLYLILNIIAHDVIHDYGSAGCSNKRWQKNVSFVKQFYEDYSTFSNPLKGGDPIGKMRRLDVSENSVATSSEDTAESLLVSPVYPGKNIYGFMPRKILKLKPRTAMDVDARDVAGVPGTSSTPILPGPEITLSRNTDDMTYKFIEYEHTIKDMKNIVNTTVIFTFFIHFLYYYNDNNINYDLSYYYIVPLSNYTDIDTELFIDLCNKFIGFCNINNIPQSLNYNEYLTVLCQYLSSYAVDQTIFENIDFDTLPVENISGVKRKLIGGVKGQANITLKLDEAQNILKEINDLTSSREIKNTLTTLNNLFKRSEQLTQEEKNNYTTMRKDFLKRYKDIFMRYGLTKKSGSLDGDQSVIPIINIRRSSRLIESINILENFKEKLTVLLADIEKIIFDDKKLQEDLEKQRIKDLNASLSGDLTSQDRNIRDKFSIFIAKSGLYLTQICNQRGEIKKSLNSLPQNSALRKEINILLYISNWTQNSGWKDIRSQDLDTILIQFFQETYSNYQITDSTGSRYICRSDSYVVNNAANVEQALKDKSFCPYSSILDGMAQCSWNTAQGSMESGNMNFKIMENDNLYYNGMMQIQPNKKDLTLSLDVKLSPNVTLNGRKTTTINGNDLEAHVVLRNTLSNVIDYIVALDDATRTRVFAGGDIFGNLFDLFVINNNFNTVYSEILFKGTGDIFQEINCVSKFGGYVMDSTYRADPGILSYRTPTGDQLRFFAANDRPSGTRFVFMLVNGRPNEINMKAVGGYYSAENLFLVKRQENTNICQLKTGGRRKKSKILTKKNHRRSNKNIKYKTNTRRFRR